MRLDYRMSKNQRLHTELGLMKLCRLKSAFEILESEEGELKKKALV